jgi:type II secretory pathway component PulC
MSVTHEALEKAAREKRRQDGYVPTPTPIPVQPLVAPPPTPHTPRVLLVVLSVAVACVAIALMVTVIWLVNNPKPVPTEIKPAVVERPSPRLPLTPTNITAWTPPPPLPTTPVQPPASVATPPEFRLSGIMQELDGKYGAVVNGQTVFAGYTVDGATVKLIERNRVVLDRNGRETVLWKF